MAKRIELTILHKVLFPEHEVNSRVNMKKRVVHQINSKFKISGTFMDFEKSNYRRIRSAHDDHVK